MEVLVGGDDGAGDFRTPQQLPMVLRDEIGAYLLRDIKAAIVILLRDADPLYGRMARRDLAAKQPDPAGTYDGKPDAFRLRSHALAPAISATAESDSFDNGRSTGALRSAERSAAV
jgi:hypothetical protein